MEVAKSTLPMTFRITSSRDSSQAVNDHVKNEFVPHLSNAVFNGEKQAPPRALEWYPGGLAWQLDVSKQVVRKSKEFARCVTQQSRTQFILLIPCIVSFQQFLVHETDSVRFFLSPLLGCYFPDIVQTIAGKRLAARGCLDDPTPSP